MRTALVLCLVGVPLPVFAGSGGGHYHSYGERPGSGQVNPQNHYTHGYLRGYGTYVPGYHATNPNETRRDNYSTKGNVNPWTGALGTK